MRNRVCLTWLMIAWWPVWCVGAADSLRVLAAGDASEVFGGGTRQLSLQITNPTTQSITTEMTGRLVQTSSSLAAPVAEFGWKKLVVLPQQTVLEQASVAFPEVRAETMFLVQWMAGTNGIAGRSLVRVHPAHPLRELRTLTEGGAVGVWDPDNVLRPLLRSAEVPFTDLSDSGFASFRGKLAVLGPFSRAEAGVEEIPARLKLLLTREVAVVCVRPPLAGPRGVQPSYWLAREGEGCVVYSSAGLVDDLAGNPRPQLNLLALCRLACQPAAWPPQPDFGKPQHSQ